MTVGAAASLTCTLNAVTNPGDEVIVIAPYFPEYRVWIEKAGCTCVEALADEDTFQLSVDNVLQGDHRQDGSRHYRLAQQPDRCRIYARHADATGQCSARGQRSARSRESDYAHLG